MSNSQLNQTTALVTRPKHQAESLCQLLKAENIQTILLPTLLIEPSINSKKLFTIFNGAKHYDIAIVLSANAAMALSPIANTLNSLKILAIGTGTQKALLNNHIHVDFIPEIFSSDGLLALPILNDIKKKSVIIFCGENSKPTLKKTLQKRGARVEEFIIYRRICPRVSDDNLKNIKAQSPNIIISTSQESLKNLVEIFSPAHTQWLYSQSLLVISTEMAQLSAKLGFKNTPMVATHATDQAIAATVVLTFVGPVKIFPLNFLSFLGWLR